MKSLLFVFGFIARVEFSSFQILVLLAILSGSNFVEARGKQQIRFAVANSFASPSISVKTSDPRIIDCIKKNQFTSPYVQKYLGQTINSPEAVPKSYKDSAVNAGLEAAKKGCQKLLSISLTRCGIGPQSSWVIDVTPEVVLYFDGRLTHRVPVQRSVYTCDQI